MLISQVNSKRLQFLLKELENKPTPQMKGRAFEKLMLQMIRYSGIEAESTASQTEFGEQIDILANWERNIFAECKFHCKPIGIQEIQAFIGRLSFREPNVMGLYISWSGYSDFSIDQIKRNQNRIIIILNREEIENIIKGVLDLEILLREKELSSLRGVVQQGQWEEINPVNCNEPNLIWKSGYVGNSTFSPEQEIEKLSSYGSSNDIHWKSRAENLRVNHVSVYIRHQNPPIRYWARFFLPKPKENRRFWELEHLLKIIRAYEQIFGFTDQISLNIGQQGIQWHYLGIQRVFKEIFHPKNRYLEMTETELNNCHYRENLALVDQNIDDDILLVLHLDTHKNNAGRILFQNYSIVLGSNKILYHNERIERLKTLIGGNLSFVNEPLNWQNLNLNSRIPSKLHIHGTFTEESEIEEMDPFYTKILLDNPWPDEIKEQKILVNTTIPLSEELPAEIDSRKLKVSQFAFLPNQFTFGTCIQFIDITYLL